MEGNFQSSFGRLEGVAKNFARNIASSLGVGLSIGAVVAFGKSVVDLAGNLKDLEQRTGVSAQTFSGLKATLEENGDTVDNFATAFGRLIKGISDGDEEHNKAIQRLKQIGFTAEEIKNAFKDPEGFLEKFAKLLAALESPTQRLGIAQEIAGRQGGQFATSLVQMADGFAKLKTSGMTQEQIDTLDKFGDSVTRISNALQVLAAQPLANLANNLEGIAKALGLIPKTAAQEFTELETRVKRLTEAVSRTFGTEVGRVLQMTNDQLKEAAKNGPPALQAAITQLLTARQQIQAILSGSSFGTGPESKPKRIPSLLPDLPKKTGTRSLSDADSFLVSLKKQADQLEINIKTELGGADAARKLGLELEFAAVKAKMLAEGKILPADFEQRFKEAVATIETLSQRLAEAKFQGARLDEVGKMFSQDSAEWLTLEKDIYGVVAALEKLTTEWDKMRVAQVGAMFDQDSAEWWTEQEGRGLEIWRQQDEIRKRAGEMFGDIGGSISRGIGDTLRGIREGSQTLSEGMRNLVQNIFLSINEQVIETTILKPIQDIVNGFFTGLAEAFATGSESSAKDIAQNLGKSLGEALRGLFSSSSSTGGIGSWIGTAFSWIGSLFTFKQGGLVPAFANGGLVKQLQRFDDGGLAIVHPNEFVIKSSSVRSIGAGNLDMMNRSGKLPGAGMSQPTPIVQINGDIIPRGKWTTPEDVVKISYKSMKDRTGVYAAMRDYGPRR